MFEFISLFLLDARWFVGSVIVALLFVIPGIMIRMNIKEDEKEETE